MSREIIIAALMLEAIHLMKQKNKYRTPKDIIKKNHTQRSAVKNCCKLDFPWFFSERKCGKCR